MLFSTPPETGVFALEVSTAGLAGSDGVGDAAGEGEGLTAGLVLATSGVGVGVGAGAGCAAAGSGVGVFAGAAKMFVGVAADATVLSVKEAWLSGSAAAAGCFRCSSASGPSGPGMRAAALSRLAETEASLPAAAPRLCALEPGALFVGAEATYSARVCVGEEFETCVRASEGGDVPTCAAFG